MIICGDFNYPNINWNLTKSTTAASDIDFVALLNDFFLEQLFTTPTRGSNMLDLVITSIPENVEITEILLPEEAGIFTDHSVVFDV